MKFYYGKVLCKINSKNEIQFLISTNLIEFYININGKITFVFCLWKKYTLLEFFLVSNIIRTRV